MQGSKKGKRGGRKKRVNFGTLGRDRSRVGAGPGIGANTHGTSSFPCLALRLARRRFGACRIFLLHWSPTRWNYPYGWPGEAVRRGSHRPPTGQVPPHCVHFRCIPGCIPVRQYRYNVFPGICFFREKKFPVTYIEVKGPSWDPCPISMLECLYLTI
jgi:hypothetical protein